MLLCRIIDDLVGKKRPILHQPEHRLSSRPRPARLPRA
jgi:hypothetical protein